MHSPGNAFAPCTIFCDCGTFPYLQMIRSAPLVGMMGWDGAGIALSAGYSDLANFTTWPCGVIPDTAGKTYILQMICDIKKLCDSGK